jgi:peptidoglycan LD-endopeptidase LytH
MLPLARHTTAYASRIALALVALAAFTSAHAQALPDPSRPLLTPAWEALSCPVRTAPETGDAASLMAFEQRQRYRDVLGSYLARLPDQADLALLMPVPSVRVAQIADTYAAARDGGRSHEGQDVFAPRGTPIVSATAGFVYEMSGRFRGGRSVMVLGPGARRYFYSHLDAYAEGLREGQWVEPGTLLGYVGNDGNAATTPPHLHFGVYDFDPATCRFRAFDPLPLMVDRLPAPDEASR